MVRASEWCRAPRSTVETRRLYLRSQGLRDIQILTLNRDAGRSAIWLARIDRYFQAERREVSGLRVERYLADAVLRWLLGRCRSEGARAKYMEIMRRWLEWAPSGRRRLSLDGQRRTVAADVTSYLRHLEEGLHYSVRTVVCAREVLRSWFGWLLELELIDRIPINREALRSWRIHPERVERGDGTRQALTIEEAQRLAHWALFTARAVQGVAVLLQTVSGLRSWEVARAERRRLTIADGITSLVVVGKGERQRVVVLEQVVAYAWANYARHARLTGNRGPLLTKRGMHYSAKTIQNWAKQGLAAIGRLDLSSHDLRRTAVTLLVERGATLEQAQKLLGHSDIKLTQQCYVLRPKPLSVTTGITGQRSA